jgi:hypothetical protein
VTQKRWIIKSLRTRLLEGGGLGDAVGRCGVLGENAETLAGQ